MGGEIEAAGDVITGALAASAIEGHQTQGPATAPVQPAETCRNCGATLTGAYCSACGQSAHVHRSLRALAHDILHGVFHFEGKVWRTLPELVWRPGRLTRRYIDGERVRFVSPMALFLFTVFLTFAVFGFVGDTDGTVAFRDDKGTAEWKRGMEHTATLTEQRIELLREERERPQLTSERRARIDSQIAELEAGLSVIEALAKGDVERAKQITAPAPDAAGTTAAPKDANASEGFSWPARGSKLRKRVDEVLNNQALLLYKVKTAAYKFSWALIPLSLPFLWLLFFWRRDIRMYDHAVFATYSISFMMLFAVLLALLAAAGVSGWLWGPALVAVPPIHLYRHLRETYGLSRLGTWVRLIVLLISIAIILLIFVMLLAIVGVLA